MKTSFLHALTRFSALVTICTIPSLHAQPANEAARVPIDLVREIIGDGNFHESLPAGFPLPDVATLKGTSLQLLGSWESGSGITAYLRTAGNSGNLEATLNALRDAYVISGWTDLSAPWSFGPPLNTPSLGIRGIPSVPASSIVRDPIIYFSLCHDQLGTLSIQPTLSPAGGNSLRISYQGVPAELPVPINCGDRQEYNIIGSPGGFSTYFLSLLPELEFPEGVVSATSSLGGTGFSPGFRLPVTNEFFNLAAQAGQDIQITKPDTNLAQVAGHYTQQLEAQDWLRDSSAAGSESRTSVWIKTVASPDIPDLNPTLRLQGALTILNSGNDTYQIWFRMTSR